jgi:hypothetical protein
MTDAVTEGVTDQGEQQEWTPAFPGQRPPFAEGNEYRVAEGNMLALRHGAYSPRKIDPLAQELVDTILQAAAVDGSPVAYLLDPTYQAALLSWGRAEAAQDLLEEHLAEFGPIDSDGKVRPAADLLEPVARRAERIRARLGLDPLSRAALAKDLAVAQSTADLDRLKNLGAALLAAHDETTNGEVDNGE